MNKEIALRIARAIEAHCMDYRSGYILDNEQLNQDLDWLLNRVDYNYQQNISPAPTQALVDFILYICEVENE